MMIPQIGSLMPQQRRRLPRLGALGLNPPGGALGAPSSSFGAGGSGDPTAAPLDPYNPLGGHPAPAAPPSAPAAPGTGSPLQPNSAYPTYNPDPTNMGGMGGFQIPHGKGSAKHINQAIARQNYALFMQSLGPLMAAQNGLIERANTDHFSPDQRSAYLAPRLDQLDAGYQQAEGQLNRNLAGRGLDTSSEAVSEFSNLAGHQASDRAGIAGGLFNLEDQRQQQAQAQLVDFLMSLSGRSSGQAASASQFQQQQNFQEAQANQQPNFLSSLLSGLTGLGGAYLSGGMGGLGGLGGGTSKGYGTASFPGGSQYSGYGMPLIY